MARFFYSLLLLVLLPVIILLLWLKGRDNPGWRKRWDERFGTVVHRPAAGGLLVHAASVGEVLAAAPFVQAFRKRHPDIPLIITTFTPTGSEQVRRIFGEGVFHLYLPFDLHWLQRRLLRALRPGAVVMMETELWPNLLAECERRKIPVLLANARLSESSARGYARFAALTRPMLQRLAVVAVQNAHDGQRFLQLGLPEQRLDVTGSVKFDLDVPEQAEAAGAGLRAQWGSERTVLALASGHADEDERLLDLYPSLCETIPDLLLLLIPRHPERFDAVSNAAHSRQLRVHRRSRGDADASVQVYVADTMGEMLMVLAAADLVLVGGSLIPRGGHNPIEPAALGKATLIGPSHHNFALIVDGLQQAGALQVIPDELPGLQVALTYWLQDADARRAMGEAGRAAVAANRGAVGRLVAHCEELLKLS